MENKTIAKTHAQTIGLFGGSFNPPHVAHVLMVGWALSVGDVDEVWAIPTGGHPFGKDLAPFADRVEMCRLAFGCFGGRVRVLDVEAEDRKHYSVDTVRRLARENPDLQWRWVIGSDALAQSAEWKDFDELRRLAPLLVIERRGHRTPGAGADPGVEKREEATASEFSLPDVSSTSIREALAAGTDDAGDRETIETLLPHNVGVYIRKHRLYGTA